MHKILASLCAAALAAFTGVAAQAEIPAQTIRLAHTAAVSHAHHEAAQLFAKNVSDRTKGKVKVEVYPAGELGDQPALAEQVTLGAMDMAVVSLGNMAMYDKKLNAMTAPFLFTDYDHAHRTIDAFVMDWMNAGLSQHDAVGLSMFDYGFRQTTTKGVPINSADDLKGLKIRVPNNPIMIATFRAWGGEPAPMAWDETFNALQQKVVDGQENPYPVFASNKFEEVQKYITEIHYKVWIGPIVVNAAWFKKQPADVQKAILEGGRLATENNRKMIAEMETDLVKVLKDKGVEILAKPEDEPVWQEKAMGVWPQFYDKIGDISLLDTMMKSLGRTRPQ